MSAALVPFASKALAGAVMGKVVGKVTGNDKLGMLAGLGVGMMNPMGFGAADTITAGAGGMGAEEVSRTVGNQIIDKVGSTGVGGLLKTGADWATANPMQAQIAASGVLGATNLYVAKKEAEALKKAATVQYGRDLELQDNAAGIAENSNRNTYERTHQGFTPRSRTAGLLEESPVAPGDDYYQQYLNTFSNKGVR